MGDKVTTMLAFRRSYQGYLWDHISGQKTVSSNQTAVDRPANPFGESGRQPAYFYDLNAKVTYTPTSVSSTARTIMTILRSSVLTVAVPVVWELHQI